MVTVTTNGNIPQQPANWDNSYVPDQLIAGVFPRVTYGSATIKSGSQVNSVTPLPRGTILGQQTIGSATAAAGGSNTGNGAIAMDGTTPVEANAQVGVYTLTCTVASTNAATFRLTDPKGNVLADYSFSGSGAHLTFNDQIKGTITDGGTDFVVGDLFTVTVAAGAGKYVPCVATATDGSQVPSAVLADQCDPSAGDANAGIYFTGEFNSNAITFDSSWTTTTLQAPLRAAGIYLKSAVSAADPS